MGAKARGKGERHTQKAIWLSDFETSQVRFLLALQNSKKPKEMNKKEIKERRPLKRNRESISDQLKSIPPGDRREWLLSEVNVSSYRTKVGDLNVKAGYSKYGLRTYPDYGVMVITNYG